MLIIIYWLQSFTLECLNILLFYSSFECYVYNCKLKQSLYAIIKIVLMIILYNFVHE